MKKSKTGKGTLEPVVRDLITAAANVLHHDDDILEGDSKECVFMRTNLAANFRAVLRKHRIANAGRQP